MSVDSKMNKMNNVKKMKRREEVKEEFNTLFEEVKKVKRLIQESCEPSKGVPIRFLSKKFNKVLNLITDCRKKCDVILRKKTQNKVGVSGITKPVDVSNDLLSYLKLSVGEKYPRCLITKLICANIKSQGMQCQDDKRYFVPDEILTSILKCEPGQKITFCGLQKYLKIHYS